MEDCATEEITNGLDVQRAVGRLYRMEFVQQQALSASQAYAMPGHIVHLIGGQPSVTLPCSPNLLAQPVSLPSLAMPSMQHHQAGLASHCMLPPPTARFPMLVQVSHRRVVDKVVFCSNCTSVYEPSKGGSKLKCKFFLYRLNQRLKYLQIRNSY